MLKALLVGNIGADPEMRFSQNGTPMLKFNVASNDRKRDRDGEWRDTTTWVQVIVFNQRAETLQNHLKKGMKVYVDGKMDAQPWTDQQGQIRAGLQVIANDVQFMSSRQDDGGSGGGWSGGGGGYGGGQQQRPQQQQTNGQRPQQEARQGGGSTATYTDPDDLEDLPF